eukprot:5761325-Prorocentrum_lima.AAC.1
MSSVLLLQCHMLSHFTRIQSSPRGGMPQRMREILWYDETNDGAAANLLGLVVRDMNMSSGYGRPMEGHSPTVASS